MARQRVSAYRLDEDLQRYEELIDELAKLPVEPHARSELARLYKDAYEESFLQRRQFPASEALRAGGDVVLMTPGVIDGAFLLPLLVNFSEGVAVGRDSRIVEQVDVERMRETLCAAWPECSRMRVEACARGLRSLVDSVRSRTRWPRGRDRFREFLYRLLLRS